MPYLILSWRIHIVMILVSLVGGAAIYHLGDRRPFPVNETTIGIMVCAAYLLSVVIGIFWDYHSKDE